MFSIFADEQDTNTIEIISVPRNVTYFFIFVRISPNYASQNLDFKCFKENLQRRLLQNLIGNSSVIEKTKKKLKPIFYKTVIFNSQILKLNAILDKIFITSSFYRKFSIIICQDFFYLK